MTVHYCSVRNKRVLYHLNDLNMVRSSGMPVAGEGNAKMKEYAHFVMDGNGILLFSE